MSYRFFLFLALALFAPGISLLSSPPAFADGGAMIVYFNCSPDKHAAYVKTAISYEPIPDFDKHITSLDTVNDEGKMLECNISQTQRLTINIRKSSSHPTNNNLIVTLNADYLGDLTFQPYHDASMLVTELDANQSEVMYFEDGIPQIPPKVVSR